MAAVAAHAGDERAAALQVATLHRSVTHLVAGRRPNSRSGQTDTRQR